MTTTNSLYETDFVECADNTARLLRKRRFEDVDLENLEVVLQRSYERAITEALRETGTAQQRTGLNLPPTCPFTVAELLNEDLDTLRARLG